MQASRQSSAAVSAPARKSRITLYDIGAEQVLCGAWKSFAGVSRSRRAHGGAGGLISFDTSNGPSTDACHRAAGVDGQDPVADYETNLS